MKKFYIPKIEGDSSDVLFARGIAELVKTVLEAAEKITDVFIKNIGQFYLVESIDEINEDDFKNVTFKALYPLIFYDKMENKPTYVWGDNLIDFTIEEEFSDWSSNKRKSSLIRQTTGIPLSNKIMDSLYDIKENFKDILYLFLSFYSEIQDDYENLDLEFDKLFDNIQLKEFKNKIEKELAVDKKLLEDIFSGFDNYHWSVRNKIKKELKKEYPDLDIGDKIKNFYEESKMDFTKSYNALSSLLPRRVKGLNYSDLSASARISPKNITESWSKLFLIMIGFYKSLVLKSLSSGNRLYSVIDPNIAHIEDFDNLYLEIHDKYYPAEILEKQNILYLSDFIIKVLDKLEDFEKRRRRQRDNRVKNYISGLKNVYLVDMGQNHVIKNIYNLNIPNWLILDHEKDKDEFKILFQEFIDLIQPINDKNEDIKIFQELYSFLTTERIDYLLNYYYYHSIMTMQRLGNNENSRIFTKRSVEFIMSKLENNSDIKYSNIIAGQGFKNFAKAIRNSTLVPIYLNEKKRVKFGLLQEIRRAALNKNTLLTMLSQFMSDYNNENGLDAFRSRDGKQKRANLTTSDYEEMVNIIDDYDSKIIGNMLLAYGFAKDDKVDEIQKEEEIENG